MIEIDTRTLGGRGRVSLLARSPRSGPYTVEVADGTGRTVATISKLNKSEARVAYLHPFARRDVPDIFSVHVDHLDADGKPYEPWRAQRRAKS